MVKTQDASCYHMQTQSEPNLRESQLAQRESREGVSPRFRVGEIHLPRLTDKCHESRVKFVYFRDKLWHDDRMSPSLRGSVDVWTTSGRHYLKFIINNIIIDY
jgi:hypothetical protein